MYQSSIVLCTCHFHPVHTYPPLQSISPLATCGIKVNPQPGTSMRPAPSPAPSPSCPHSGALLQAAVDNRVATTAKHIQSQMADVRIALAAIAAELEMQRKAAPQQQQQQQDVDQTAEMKQLLVDLLESAQRPAKSLRSQTVKQQVRWDIWAGEWVCKGMRPVRAAGQPELQAPQCVNAYVCM